MKKIFVILAIFSLFFLEGFTEAKVSQGAGAPSAPSNLAAMAVSTSQINLAWIDHADNETGFKVERGQNGVNFVEIATVGANVTTFADVGLDKATTYYYRVRAYKVQGNGFRYSAFSNLASDTTFDVAPTAPDNLNVVPSLSQATSSIPFMDLGWQDNADNEVGFKVERSTSGVNFVQIATVGANNLGYRDWGVISGVTYYYRVRAYNNFGDSVYSNTAYGTTL